MCVCLCVTEVGSLGGRDYSSDATTFVLIILCTACAR